MNAETTLNQFEHFDNHANDSGETYVLDSRDEQRPSEFVQSKLMSSLPPASIPVSSLHTYRNCNR